MNIAVFDIFLHKNTDVLMTNVTNPEVEKCDFPRFALKSSKNEQKSLKSIGFEA